jgi:hypothetical protein
MDSQQAESAGPGAMQLLLGIVAAALVIGRFGGPIGDWVGAVGTAAHEAGHAAFADVLTGRVISITVFRDGGGVTLSQASESDWRTFLVSGAGYPRTLFAALGLLTGVLFGRSSRLIAGAAAFAAFVALLFWTPFNSHVEGISDGDQRFTWIILALSVGLLGGAAALPDRFDTSRRVVLGALALGLLTDAFRATKDLVVIEDLAGATATDADGLAEAVGVFGAGTWSWLMRLALFAIAAGWAWLVIRRWGAESPLPDGTCRAIAPGTGASTREVPGGELNLPRDRARDGRIRAASSVPRRPRSASGCCRTSPRRRR